MHYKLNLNPLPVSSFKVTFNLGDSHESYRRLSIAEYLLWITLLMDWLVCK